MGVSDGGRRGVGGCGGQRPPIHRRSNHERQHQHSLAGDGMNIEQLMLISMKAYTYKSEQCVGRQANVPSPLNLTGYQASYSLCRSHLL